MSSRFEVVPTPLRNLNLLQRKPLGDDRGYLERIFCAEELKIFMLGRNIVQINHTFTGKAGTVRGMHFQSPPMEKLSL